MGISKTQRRKQAAAAQRLLPSAHVGEYVVGRTGANPMAVGGALLAGFVGFGALSVALFGTVIVPGALPLLVAFHFMSPPRGVVIAHEGVAVTKRSLWNGKPNGVVHLIGHGHVQPTAASAGRVKVAVGSEFVWLSSAEEGRLRAALGRHVAPPPAADAAAFSLGPFA